MLIIKLSQNENNKKKYRFKSNRRVCAETVTRYNKTIHNRVYTVVDMPLSSVDDFETQRLLKRFKGSVLMCGNCTEADDFKEFLFDCKPYYKKALLSSLKNHILGFRDKKFTLTICDDSFEMTEEAVNLVKIVGTLIIEGDENLAMQEFSDYCYFNYGAFVRLVPKGTIVRTDMYVDLNKVTDEAKLFVKLKGREMLLYPDPNYFQCKNDAAELVSLGVPVKTACAATAVNKALEWSDKTV